MSGCLDNVTLNWYYWLVFSLSTSCPSNMNVSLLFDLERSAVLALRQRCVQPSFLFIKWGIVVAVKCWRICSITWSTWSVSEGLFSLFSLFLKIILVSDVYISRFRFLSLHLKHDWVGFTFWHFGFINLSHHLCICLCMTLLWSVFSVQFQFPFNLRWLQWRFRHRCITQRSRIDV